jgi:hypothetical protein
MIAWPAVACIDALVDLAKWDQERDGPLGQELESVGVVAFVLSFLYALYHRVNTS